MFIMSFYQKYQEEKTKYLALKGGSTDLDWNVDDLVWNVGVPPNLSASELITIYLDAVGGIDSDKLFDYYDQISEDKGIIVKAFFKNNSANIEKYNRLPWLERETKKEKEYAQDSYNNIGYSYIIKEVAYDKTKKEKAKQDRELKKNNLEKSTEKLANIKGKIRFLRKKIKEKFQEYCTNLLTIKEGKTKLDIVEQIEAQLKFKNEDITDKVKKEVIRKCFHYNADHCVNIVKALKDNGFVFNYEFKTIEKKV